MEESPLFIDERSSLYQIPVSRWTPSSGLPLLALPQLGLCQWPTGCPTAGCAFFPSSCLCSSGAASCRKGAGLRAPCSRSRLFRPSLLSWVMRALPSGRVRDKQPVHRQLHEVAVQEASKQWALVSSAPKPPRPPPPKKSAPVSPR